MRQRHFQYFILVGVCFLTTLAYLSCVHGEFLLDDLRLIQSPFAIRSIDDFVLSWQRVSDFENEHGVVLPDNPLFLWYRPLPRTTFLILKAVFGANPLPYHLLNISLHLACIVSLYFVVRRFLQNRAALTLCLLFFALNPYQTDAVAWISGCCDVFACLFILLAILTYLDTKNPLIGLLGTATFCLLALFSKETSLVFFGIVPLLATYKGATLKQMLTLLFVIGLAQAVYIFARVQALNDVEIKFQILAAGDFLSSAPLFVVESFLKLFSWFQVHVVMLREEWWSLLPGNRILKSTIGIVGWISFIIVYSRLALQKKTSPAWIPILVSYLFVLPVLYLLNFKYASPRMFYVPTLGVALFLGCAVEWGNLKFPHLSKYFILLAVAFGTLMFVGTSERAMAYRNAMSLWESEIQNSPESPYGYQFYSYHLMRAGRFEEALPLLRRASTLQPDAVEIQNNLGVCYLNLGRLDEAEGIFRGILKGKAQSCKAQYHLALIYDRRGQLHESQLWVHHALENCPRHEGARELLNQLVAKSAKALRKK